MNIDTKGLELGDIVRDPLYDIQGPIIGFTQWMTGCARATIVRGYDKDGKLLESHGADVLILELVQKGRRGTYDRSTGGPMPEPPSR